MKNIIYLSVIALASFCSCKQGSFLTQRYTHYSGSSKNPSNHVAVQKATPKVYKPEAAQVTAVVENVQAPVASVDNSMANNKAAYSLSKPVETKTVKNYNAPKLKDVGAAMATSTAKVIKNQKSNVEKSSHRGLIFGLIDLALFIVIVAVIVIAVIFLVVLVI